LLLIVSFFRHSYPSAHFFRGSPRVPSELQQVRKAQYNTQFFLDTHFEILHYRLATVAIALISIATVAKLLIGFFEV
jgi:hypothetical protein